MTIKKLQQDTAAVGLQQSFVDDTGGGPIEFLSATVVLDNDAIKAMHGTPQELIALTETLNYAGSPTQIPMMVWASAILNDKGGNWANTPNPANLLLVWGSDWSMTIGKAMQRGSVLNVTGDFGSGNALNDWYSFTSLDWDSALRFDGALKDNGVYIVMAGDGGGGDTVGPLTGGNALATLTLRLLYTLIDL